MKEKILAVIDYDPKIGMYGARTENLAEFLGTGMGKTEDEALAELQAGLDEFAEMRKEEGLPIPEWYSKEIKFEVRYDVEDVFEMFPCLNVSELGKAVGINPSLMRQYKAGTAFPSAKQRAKIQAGYDKLVARMAQVRW